MPVSVSQSGSTVTVTAQPRGIASLNIVSNELIVTYTSGVTESAGFVGSTDVLPDNAKTSGVDGDLLLSPITGEQLVGV